MGFEVHRTEYPQEKQTLGLQQEAFKVSDVPLAIEESYHFFH